MPIFTATFKAHAFSAAEDVFEIVASASNRVEIREIIIGQYSDFGDAQAEILSVLIERGNTVAGSGGAAATPSNLEPWSRAAGTTVLVNNTTPASGGTPQTMRADTMNVAAGYWLNPPIPSYPHQLSSKNSRIKLDAGQRLVVRLSAPADALTLNGTLEFEELPL